MKKILLAFAILTSTAGVSAAIFITSCGKAVTSLDRSAFPTPQEWEGFVSDLNLANCGVKADMSFQVAHIYGQETYVLF